MDQKVPPAPPSEQTVVDESDVATIVEQIKATSAPSPPGEAESQAGTTPRV